MHHTWILDCDTKTVAIHIAHTILPIEIDGWWVDSNDDWSANLLPAFYLILSNTIALYGTCLLLYARTRASQLKNFKKSNTLVILYWQKTSYFKVTLTPHSFIAFRELNTSFLVRLPISLADLLQFGKHGLHVEYDIAASQSGSRKILSSFSTINRYSFDFFCT